MNRVSTLSRAGVTLLLAFLLPVGAGAGEAPTAPRAVTLQLKWRHQFQFAGYYAAQAQGYYADEGLDVTIVEGAADRPPLQTVLDGRAQYGVAGADVLEARLAGKGVVVLAVIFQHSPYVLIVRLDSGISRPEDLVGRKVMLASGQGEAEFMAMLLRQQIPPDAITRVEHTWNNQDLVDGRVSALSGYISVEPYQIRRLGTEVGTIRPVDYGIDFYGDSLFTTDAEVESHPERAAAMRRASIRGWEYALSHVDEMVRTIMAMPGAAERGVTPESLRFEATRMRELILPDLIELGHINPRRWQRMAETYASVGLAAQGTSLDGFVFDPAPDRDRTVLRLALAATLVLSLVIALAYLWNRQLRRLVRARTDELLQSERELERRVRERTADLQTTNRELEAFGYSVSHDLRAPLRHVAGFSRILLEEHAANLDAEARSYLERIVKATTHMAELTEGLLSLARVAGSEMRWEQVDLSALAGSVATELQRAAPDRRVTFAITPGLTAWGDTRLLRQLWENLLDNAWKYTSRHPQAHIEAGVAPAANGDSGERVYFVRDDGAGFDMAAADRLFAVFRRLHDPREFEGTGVGLATVQRIVHRHGGRIWAEAAPEKGATFYFTLGKPPSLDS